MKATRVRFRRPFLAAALAALGAAAPARAQQGPPEPNLVYEFEAPLAAVCLDGSFPLTLEVPGAPVAGTLAVTTDVRGRLAGTFTAGAAVLEATGRVRYGPGGDSLRLLLKGPGERIALKGALEPGTFAGDTKGKGALAPGRNTFALDVSAAAPSVARIAVVIPPGGGSRLSGGGTVQVCGDPLGLASVRKEGGDFRLSLRAQAFRWNGSGPPGAEPGAAAVSWTARGFGAKASGAGLDLAVVPPPADIVYADPAPLFEAEEPATPDVPAAGGGPVKAWTVSPALPAGLVLDPATGTVSGTAPLPSSPADYTVTASNLAGSASAVLRLGVRVNRGYSFAPEARALGDGDLRHFLGRTHFGVKDAELAAVKAAGLPAYLDDMLVLPSGTAVETAAFAELVNSTDPAGLEGGFPSGTQLSRWWTRLMVDTDRPFQEVMAFFWHDHMPVSWEVLGGGQTHWFVSYVNLFRHGGTGNLRDLLLAMSREPAMLVYLDGFSNTKTAPNENFAREFWELFTLGADNGYTQDDIVQAAKAFTGWRQRYNSTTGQYYAEFDPNRHDTGSKTFLGVTIPGQNLTDDYAAVVDATLANRPVAEFVARRLFEHFCHEAPPAELVDAMAASIRDGGWELAPFLKSLFLSEAFFSRKSRAGRVKGPVEFGVGLVRSTGLKLTVASTDSWFNILGQRPGNPPTVNGWPGGTLWFSAASMVNRTNLAYAVVGDTTRQRSVGIEVANILPPVAERTAPAVVDALTALLRVPVTEAERQALVDYLGTQRLSNGTVVSSPFDGSSQTHLDERVRGLLYILAQNPGFQVK